MVITLELPFRTAPAALFSNLFASYESRFGALPIWLDGVSRDEAKSLRRGAPFVPADLPY